MHDGKHGYVHLASGVGANGPAEFSGVWSEDVRSIDSTIDDAVEGRVTEYRYKRGGGCIEVEHDGKVTRSWTNALPLPGWRRRSQETVKYAPYR